MFPFLFLSAKLACLCPELALVYLIKSLDFFPKWINFCSEFQHQRRLMDIPLYLCKQRCVCKLELEAGQRSPGGRILSILIVLCMHLRYWHRLSFFGPKKACFIIFERSLLFYVPSKYMQNLTPMTFTTIWIFYFLSGNTKYIIEYSLSDDTSYTSQNRP